MIQTKYLISLIFLLSGGANGIAFGPKLFNSGGAFLQKVNDILNTNSKVLEELSQAETARLLKEKAESTHISDELERNSQKMTAQREQSNAIKKEVEAKLKETNEHQERQKKQLEEYREKMQKSYDEEIQKSIQELQQSAETLSQKFKTTWETQEQAIQKILKEIQESNKTKIEQLAKDIENLPNKIFEDSSSKKD